MANIQIEYSQAVVDKTQQLKELYGSDTSLSSLVDSMLEIIQTINTDYYYFTSWSFGGNTLRVNFPDGASTTFTGSVSNPNAASGTASVTNVSFNLPNALTASQSGSINYVWQAGANSLSFYPTEGNITALGISSQIPAGSPYYDQNVGNSTLVLSGNVRFDANRNLSGSISSISSSGQKFIQSSTVTGDFMVGGNLTNIGQKLADSHVAGIMRTSSTKYYDGSRSSADFSDKPLTLANKQAFDLTALSNPANFSGNDQISIKLPDRIYENYFVASGTGDDQVFLEGGGGKLSADAGAGSDAIRLADHGHRVDGGTGFDTLIYSGKHSAHQIQRTSGDTIVVSELTGGPSDSLTGVERIKFDDKTIGFDTEGVSGKSYRIYKAAFNREPDAGGLGYWTSRMDKGMDMVEVAARFIDSPEFRALYGSDPTNAAFLGKVYRNVLGREPEAAGFDWWLNEMQTNPSKTKAKVLADFSESAENKAGVAGLIGNGILFDTWT